MATAVTGGYGTLIKIGDGGGSESFTAIAEVMSISGPNLKLETVDATSLDSANGYRESIAILKDGGEVSLDLMFLPQAATHGTSSGLLRDLDAGNKRNFKIEWADANTTSVTFAAFVTSYDPNVKVDDKMTARVTLKITGKPTFAA